MNITEIKIEVETTAESGAKIEIKIETTAGSGAKIEIRINVETASGPRSKSMSRPHGERS